MSKEQIQIVNEVMEKFYNSEPEYKEFANVQCYIARADEYEENFCTLRIPMNLVRALDELERKGAKWMPMLDEFIEAHMYSFSVNRNDDLNIFDYGNVAVDVTNIEDITNGFAYKSAKEGYEWTVDKDCEIYPADVSTRATYLYGSIVVDCISPYNSYSFHFDVKGMLEPEIATDPVINPDTSPC